ncbi:MAG TPA: ABC transporter permease [Caproiciproducens sp.]|nr:ABC transporter permease [Caproiciproducens sp.]
MTTMLRRNLKCYFRNKSSVFFSVLTVLIAFSLYIFFLGDNTAENFKNVTGFKFLLDSWIMAGILSITGVTTTLGALEVMVQDNENRISNDFLTSPLKRSHLAGGYVLSTFVIGMIMSLLALLLAELYIAARDGQLLTVVNLLKVLGVILLSVTSSSAVAFFLVSFINSRSSFTAVDIIVGTAIGFIAGVYIPIGSMNSSVQFVMKLFPVSYTASLLRTVMMDQAMAKTFASAPAETVETFKQDMGIAFQFSGQTVSMLGSIMILLAVTVLFYSFVVVRLNRKKL